MAKPKLALIPATQGSKLYSVLPADGVGDFTFSRNSAATRINKEGLIETVASGVSRLNYPLIDGVVNGCPSHLLEPQRTNGFQHSEDFSTGSWSKGNLSVVSNQAISPDGILNAYEIIPNSVTSAIRLYQSETVYASDYSLSFYVKYNGKQFVQLLWGGTINSTDYANFDLINGTVTFGANGKIESLKNDWYRISISSTLSSGADQIYLWSIDSANAARGATSTGNGVDGYYLWGAQIELGSYPSSYIRNLAIGSTTRSAETANGAGDASTFNDSEGVLMAEISALADDGSYKTLTINNNGISDRIQISINSNNVFIGVIDGGSAEIFQSYSVSNITNNNKIAVKYKLNDCSLWINGIAVLDNLAASMPSGLSKISFDKGNGADDFYGSAKQIQYFDSALTDAELAALTT